MFTRSIRRDDAKIERPSVTITSTRVDVRVRDERARSFIAMNHNTSRDYKLLSPSSDIPSRRDYYRSEHLAEKLDYVCAM